MSSCQAQVRLVEVLDVEARVSKQVVDVEANWNSLCSYCSRAMAIFDKRAP